MRELRLLRKLNFQRNPIQEMSDYRLSILYRLQMLAYLDGMPATANEKVNILPQLNRVRAVSYFILYSVSIIEISFVQTKGMVRRDQNPINLQ